MSASELIPPRPAERSNSSDRMRSGSMTQRRGVTVEQSGGKWG